MEPVEQWRSCTISNECGSLHLLFMAWRDGIKNWGKCISDSGEYQMSSGLTVVLCFLPVKWATLLYSVSWETALAWQLLSTGPKTSLTKWMSCGMRARRRDRLTGSDMQLYWFWMTRCIFSHSGSQLYIKGNIGCAIADFVSYKHLELLYAFWHLIQFKN